MSSDYHSDTYGLVIENSIDADFWGALGAEKKFNGSITHRGIWTLSSTLDTSYKLTTCEVQLTAAVNINSANRFANRSFQQNPLKVQSA